MGQYSEYREYVKEQEAEEAQQAKLSAEKAAKNVPVPTQTTQRQHRRKLSFKEQRELEQIEIELPKLEAEKSKLEAELSSGELSHERLMETSARISAIIESIEEKEMRWLELSEI